MTTKERILEAAERIMRAKGLAHCTTKEIAREAGFSEGTLYKHFQSKEELCLAVLRERLPSFIALVKTLHGRVGRDTVQEVLGEVANSATAFYNESLPIIASIFSESGLLERYRDELRRQGGGPQRANEALVAYLRGEQQLGRIHADVDADAVAAQLLGACFQQAFFEQLLKGSQTVPDSEDAISAIVKSVVRSVTARKR